MRRWRRSGRMLQAAKVDGIVADFSGAAGAEAVIAKLPAVDVLVNNVGIFEPKPFAEIPDADWSAFSK